jgi:hypothetical protein
VATTAPRCPRCGSIPYKPIVEQLDVHPNVSAAQGTKTTTTSRAVSPKHSEANLGPSNAEAISRSRSYNTSDAKGKSLFSAPLAEGLQNAGFLRRSLAFLLDGVLLSIPVLLIDDRFNGILATFIAENAHGDLEKIFARLFWIYLLPILGPCGVIGLFDREVQGAYGLIADWVFLLMYYAAFEASPLKATPGKLAVGVEVVRENGRRVSFFLSGIRRMLTTISVCFLFAIGLTIVVSWLFLFEVFYYWNIHNRLTHCRVVLRMRSTTD